MATINAYKKRFICKNHHKYTNFDTFSFGKMALT